jgi:hypothetical protein
MEKNKTLLRKKEQAIACLKGKFGHKKKLLKMGYEVALQLIEA